MEIKFKGEEGLDYGGLRKGYFEDILKELFSAKYGMFKLCEESNLYWFDGNSPEPPLTFELVGILLGLAMYNNGSPCGPEEIAIKSTIEVPLAPAIYKILTGSKPDFFDLSQYDPDLYRNLNLIKTLSAGELEGLYQTFSVTEDSFGV